MKKVICLLCLVLLLCACSTKKAETTYDRITTIEEIQYEQLNEKLNQNIDFLLYIGRPDCSDCAEFYPYLEEYVQTNGKGIYYLNIKNFRDNAKKEEATQAEVDFYNNLQKELNFDWTPTLQHYRNGELIDDYTFLDLDYYNISDSNKKEQKYNEFVELFKEWMNKNYSEQ